MSAVRKKAFSRTDLIELQTTISKLQRDLDLQSALSSDQAQSVEYVGGQVEALRNAYSTLSDVMVDEIEAVRTECRTLRRELHARAGESETSRTRTSKLMRQLRQEVAQLKEDAARKDTELAALKTKTADTSLSTKVATMADEMRVLREDNRELRAMLDTSLSTLREQVIGISSDMTTTKHQMGEVARLSSDLDATKALAAEGARQHHSLRTGVATCADGVQKMRQEMAALRAAVASVKQHHNAAATALAQDVALLAEDAAATKHKSAEQAAKYSTKFKSIQQQLERTRADGADSVKSKLVAFRQDMMMQQEQFRQALAMVQRQQTRLKSKLEDKVRADAQEITAVQSATRALENNVTQQFEDLRDRLAMQGEESHKQFEAVSHAVHAFADIMNEPGASPAHDGSGAGASAAML